MKHRLNTYLKKTKTPSKNITVKTGDELKVKMIR